MKRYFLFMLLILTLTGCTGGSRSSAPDGGSFEVTVLQAGKADAIVLMTENHSLIIDCGEKDDGDKITEYLKRNGVSHVDCIFITHFDKDHAGGFPEVAENITADNIFVPNYEGGGKAYERYIKAADEHNLNVTVLTADMSFSLDDVLFEVSVPKKQTYTESDNDYSLAVSVTHGENTFLFTGDAKEERLTEILSESGRRYDLLKVPHHGRYNEKTAEFINVISPVYAVICDSEKNPADERTLSALESAGSTVYRTKDGSVSFSSDGRKITASR